MIAEHGELPPLGFLHTFYYQSLYATNREENQ